MEYKYDSIPPEEISEELLTELIDSVANDSKKELLYQLDMILKGGAGSGNHGHRGRQGLVGGSGSGGMGVWKPSGTLAEATEFSKNSGVKGIYYHGTTSSNANKIVKEGFKISDGRLGKAVYLTDLKRVADSYAYGKGTKPTRIELRVNAKKVWKGNEKQFSKDAGVSYQTTSFDKPFNKFIKKYDALEIEQIGIFNRQIVHFNNLIVLNPKNIMVIKE